MHMFVLVMYFHLVIFAPSIKLTLTISIQEDIRGSRQNWKTYRGRKYIWRFFKQLKARRKSAIEAIKS